MLTYERKSGKSNERILKKIDVKGGQIDGGTDKGTDGQTDFNSQNPPTEPGVH